MGRLEILLLVEDDVQDAALTSQIVRTVSADIAIVVQPMGETALEYLTKTTHPPQLILLDIGLPKMDGFEFINRLRKIRKLNPVPVVILTGAALDVARAHAEQVAAGYLVKPMNPDQFRSLLMKLGFDI